MILNVSEAAFSFFLIWKNFNKKTLTKNLSSADYFRVRNDQELCAYYLQ